MTFFFEKRRMKIFWSTWRRTHWNWSISVRVITWRTASTQISTVSHRITNFIWLGGLVPLLAQQQEADWRSGSSGKWPVVASVKNLASPQARPAPTGRNQKNVSSWNWKRWTLVAATVTENTARVALPGQQFQKAIRGRYPADVTSDAGGLFSYFLVAVSSEFVHSKYVASEWNLSFWNGNAALCYWNPLERRRIFWMSCQIS